MKTRPIDKLVKDFIDELKRTPEYKQAWNTMPNVEQIVFDFATKQFYDIWTFKINNDRIPVCITMNEEVLLGK